MSLTVEASLEGETFEKKYEWASAAKWYQSQLVSSPSRDNVDYARRLEKIGYCYERSATQASSYEEFKSRTLKAVKNYEEAIKRLRNIKEHGPQADSLRLKAASLNADATLVTSVSKRVLILRSSADTARGALEAYGKLGIPRFIIKTSNDLIEFCLWDLARMERNHAARIKILREGVDLCRRAVELRTEPDADWERARAHAYLCEFLNLLSAANPEEAESERLFKEAAQRGEMAVEISEKMGDEFLLGLSKSYLADAVPEDDRAIPLIERALRHARVANDLFLVGYVSFQLLCRDRRAKILAEEDPVRRQEKFAETEELSEFAFRCFSTIGRDDLIALTHSLCRTDIYVAMANFEVDPTLRREFKTKATSSGQIALKYARRSGSVWAMPMALHGLSKAFYYQAEDMSGPPRKRLIHRALTLRKEDIKWAQLSQPSFYWNRGVVENYLALLQVDLARMEKTRQRRVGFLTQAAASMEKCLDLCKREFLPRGIEIPTSLVAPLSDYHKSYGQILEEIHRNTGEARHLARAVQVYRDAVEHVRKIGLSSRAGELTWRIARLHTILLDHVEASRDFQSAAEEYLEAMKKTPQLEEFYRNYSVYMQAWSEVALAWHHHYQEAYDKAHEHYLNASKHLASTSAWDYLAPNFRAWAVLEAAEHLSRAEKGQDSILRFGEAAELFAQSGDIIRKKLGNIHSDEEKKTAKEIQQASSIRKRYCTARISLEEARIKERGEYYLESAAGYSRAEKQISEVVDAMSPSDRDELLPVLHLTQAWKTLALARAKESPRLYLEASALFERAAETSKSERSGRLALANSHMCKALEAWEQFESKGDLAAYKAAKMHLEKCKDLYLKNDAQDASLWVRATQSLVDAHMHIANAEEAAEPAVRAKQYEMAEICLSDSSEIYGRAGYEKRKNYVLKTLGEIRDRKKLAVSLVAIAVEPRLVSSTRTFASPAPTLEQATGLDVFEAASVRASLKGPANVPVGRDFEVQLDLANVGRGTAILVKAENMIPQGFEVSSPLSYIVDGSDVVLRGKRLESMKMEEVRLRLKSSRKGSYVLKPKVYYVDEKGASKVQELEPVSLQVSELGITGWLKGPG